MKRSALLATVTSIALLTACGGGESPEESESPSPEEAPSAQEVQGSEEPSEEAPSETEEASPSETPSAQDIGDVGFPVGEIEDYLDAALAEDPSAETIAELAAQAMVTWDTREDTFQGQSENRARVLLDQEVYGDDLTQPENPVFPDGWREVYEEGATSVPVVNSIDEYEEGNGFWQFTVEMCWVWVTDSGEQVPGGPRHFDFRTEEQNGANVIYNYSKTDPHFNNPEDEGEACENAGV